MTMPDFQLYPWNLDFIKNVEDIVIFQTRKEFISVRLTFSLLFIDKECSIPKAEKPQMKMGFKETKYLYPLQTYTNLIKKDTVENGALPL